MEPARIAQSTTAFVRPARSWLEGLARWGFVANAIVYLIIGALIVRWAMGRGTDYGVGWCLEIQALGSAARRGVVGISRFGIGARAAVIAAFGVLILRAAARGSAETPGAIESIHTVA